nr:MAG TPA: hypothetical protein [Caudoviricetes sp.]
MCEITDKRHNQIFKFKRTHNCVSSLVFNCHCPKIN